MSDKHTLTLDHQVQQSRKVKNLTAENARIRAEVARLRQLLLDAPCTCPDADTAIGMLPDHDNDNKNCFLNRANKLMVD